MPRRPDELEFTDKWVTSEATRRPVTLTNDSGVGGGGGVEEDGEEFPPSPAGPVRSNRK